MVVSQPFRNRPVYSHDLVGGPTRIYRPDLPEYDPDTAEPGTLVVGPGMPVGIKAVFYNWNNVPGLDMIYVYCFATGQHTHVTPFDLGLTPLEPDTNGGGEPFGDALLVNRHDGCYYMGPLEPAKQILLDEYGEFITEQRVPVGHPDNDTWKYIVSEHRGGEGSGPDNPNQWGSGFTSDEAWRYLAGADFGPTDDEFNEQYLRSLIAETTARMEKGKS